MGRALSATGASHARAFLLVLLAALSPVSARADGLALPLDEEDRLESGEPAHGAPLWLALTGQLATGPGGRALGFVVALGGSFERLFGPRRVRAPARAERRATDEAFDTFDDPRDTPAPKRRGGEPASDVEPTSEVELTSDVELTTDDEPTGDARGARLAADGAFARGLVRAALKSARSGEKRDHLDGLAARARASALLPDVRVRVGRNLDQAVALVPSATDPLRMTATDGEKLLLEGRATFRLDRLVFAEEEVHVERLRVERERLDKSLAEEVLRDLAAWQRAELAAREPALTGAPAVENEVARLSASEALDVLSDGWFSAHVRALPLEREPEATKARSPDSSRERRASPHASTMPSVALAVSAGSVSASWGRGGARPGAAP